MYDADYVSLRSNRFHHGCRAARKVNALMRPRTIWLVIVCFLLFSGSAFAAAESIRQIHKALQAGEIDYRAALNYKVYAVFKSHKLPRAFRSAGPPIKSATPVIHEAKRNAHLLSDDNLFILRRPTDATDPDYYGTGVPVLTYDSPAGHFKIHYTENNTNGDAVYGSDGNPSTIPAMVVDLATYLDAAWNQVINSMGYLQTPGDGTAGGDGKLDVYLKRIDAYGYTAWDTSPADVYIVLNNDYSVGFPQNLDPDGSMQGSLKVAAAHEFFHTSQFQYTATSGEPLVDGSNRDLDGGPALPDGKGLLLPGRLQI